jgi:hypothetical protein
MAEGGREKQNGPGKGDGPSRVGLQEKEKRGRGRFGLIGLKTRRGKRNSFAFLKLIQTIQFKLKFREFKFKLNNKQ